MKQELARHTCLTPEFAASGRPLPAALNICRCRHFGHQCPRRPITHFCRILYPVRPIDSQSGPRHLPKFNDSAATESHRERACASADSSASMRLGHFELRLVSTAAADAGGGGGPRAGQVLPEVNSKGKVYVVASPGSAFEVQVTQISPAPRTGLHTFFNVSEAAPSTQPARGVALQSRLLASVEPSIGRAATTAFPLHCHRQGCTWMGSALATPRA